MSIFATAILITTAILALGAALIIIPIRKKPQRKWVYFVTIGPGIILTLIGVIAVLGVFQAQTELRALDADVQEHIDKPAPELAFTTLGEEQEMRISDYRGQTVMINFWATWCPPCIEEMPDLSELADAYSDELVILCLSDEDAETVESWVSETPGLNQKIGLVDKADIKAPFNQMFAVRPATFILDEEGVVREYIRGSRNYEEFEEYMVPHLSGDQEELTEVAE